MFPLTKNIKDSCVGKHMLFFYTRHIETCVLLYREDYKSGKKNIKAEVKAEM